MIKTGSRLTIITRDTEQDQMIIIRVSYSLETTASFYFVSLRRDCQKCDNTDNRW